MRATLILGAISVIASVGCETPKNISLDDVERRIAVLEAKNTELQKRLDVAESDRIECRNLKASLSALTSKIAMNKEDIEDLDTRITATYEYAVGFETDLEALDKTASQLQERANVNEAAIVEQGRVAAGFSEILDVVRLDDAGDVVLEGANLHVRNGAPDAEEPNGKGNLIIGYDEIEGWCTDGLGGHCTKDKDCYGGSICEILSAKSGSHNLVIGPRHSYPSFDSLLVGFENAANSAGCFVAGQNNSSNGLFSSIAGGSTNTASGRNSTVAGGYGNEASEYNSTVTGGYDNTASDWYSTVAGGTENTASGKNSMVCGGVSNTAVDDGQVISNICVCSPHQ